MAGGHPAPGSSPKFVRCLPTGGNAAPGAETLRLVLHMALIAAGIYACVALLAYIVVLPILRAGRAAQDASDS
jgi:hypothetical protein